MEITSGQTIPTAVLGDAYFEGELSPEEQVAQSVIQEGEMPETAPTKGFLCCEGKLYSLQDLKNSWMPSLSQNDFKSLVKTKLNDTERLECKQQKPIDICKSEKKVSGEKNEVSKKITIDLEKSDPIVPRNHEKIGSVGPKVIHATPFKEKLLSPHHIKIKERQETHKKEDRSEKKENSSRVKEKEIPFEKKIEREEKREFRDEKERREKRSNDEEQEERKKPHSQPQPDPKNDLTHYLAQESTQLSGLLHRRVTHFDIILLFIEVLKLALKEREQERRGRWEERELELKYLEQVVENLRKQSKSILWTGIGTGALGITSGLLPIVGYMKGKEIIDIFKNAPLLGSLDKITRPIKAFEGLSKTTQAMGDMYKSTGEMQRTFSEGHRTRDQHLSDLHKSDGDEISRTIEEIKDYWKNIENFMYESLRMDHEVIRQLYS